MLEAKLSEAGILKRLLDAIKELVADANFECNEEGVILQAMDNSHVALVAVKLLATGFKKYRCDRPLPLGVNLGSFTKVLRCAKDDDACILKAADDADILSLTYEARNTDRIAEYEMKLMDIDADTLQIPDTDYDARVTMPSSEFSRIVRDLSQLGESVRIEVSKEGVRFISEGEAANGNILLKQTEGAGKRGSSSKRDEDEDDEDERESEDEDRDRKARAKKEKVKKEDGEDVDMNGDAEDGDEEGDGEFKSKGEDDDDDDDDEKPGKKRKKAPAKKSKPAKKAKKADDEDASADAVTIELNQHVNLTFSLKYLVNFAKSSSLSNVVQLMMSNDVPLLVSYDFGQGYIRYYLAPKIGDD
ncbi:proliferating cell nuclear antigen [Wolfiporia cocos MD-104 SS10]|uniref:DNA sliding clamp PCNA n=1 Tax=Wolfiporia cocos (strain MD-104) TaxID=742152 RepID=A0A2H3JSK7_WOLCO|nr:proliferating cell nuclear antigen [Wolfiporia cocos MD-104 SS10]